MFRSPFCFAPCVLPVFFVSIGNYNRMQQFMQEWVEKVAQVPYKPRGLRYETWEKLFAELLYTTQLYGVWSLKATLQGVL